MGRNAMQPPKLPLVQTYRPRTFLEQGVAVPFTTPLLMGTRVRAGDGSVELMVPNPAGGRGLYILAWEHVKELCQPTAHDVVLCRRITALAAISPASVRTVARAVAAEGLAGEAAAAAAVAADTREREAKAVTNSLLRMALLEQVAPHDICRGATVAEDESRVRQAVASIAPRLALSPEDVESTLAQLAEAFQQVGAQGQAPPARLPRLLALLEQVCAEVAGWGGDDADGEAAALVCGVAELTSSIAERNLNDARLLTADMPGLLQKWAQEPRTITKATERPDWVLDGWEQICLSWRSADDDKPVHDVLAEMARMVPGLPREAADWVGGPPEVVEKLNRVGRSVPSGTDWRNGMTAFSATARNERLRALVA